MINVEVKFGRITASNENVLKGITFNTTANKHTYTVDDIPALSKLVDKTIFSATMDSSNLISGGSVLITWDGENLVLSNYININGGEKVNLIYF